MRIFDLICGGGLVWLGVVGGSIADHIRGLRFAKEMRSIRAQESAPPKPRLKSVPASPVPITSAHAAMARDVVAALTTAGFHKKLATEAVEACAGSETGTIEQWTRAALRRAVK